MQWRAQSYYRGILCQGFGVAVACMAVKPLIYRPICQCMYTRPPVFVSLRASVNKCRARITYYGTL